MGLSKSYTYKSYPNVDMILSAKARFGTYKEFCNNNNTNKHGYNYDSDNEYGSDYDSEDDSDDDNDEEQTENMEFEANDEVYKINSCGTLLLKIL